MMIWVKHGDVPPVDRPKTLNPLNGGSLAGPVEPKMPKISPSSTSNETSEMARTRHSSF